jgi:hypothetical protein
MHIDQRIIRADGHPTVRRLDGGASSVVGRERAEEDRVVDGLPVLSTITSSEVMALPSEYIERERHMTGFVLIYIAVGIVGFVIAVLIRRTILGTRQLVKQGEESLFLLRRIAAKLESEVKPAEVIPPGGASHESSEHPQSNETRGISYLG